MCIQNNQLAVAYRDKKIRIYNADTLQATRELTLAREDNLVAIQFHPKLENEILILYNVNKIKDQQSDLRRINIITGESQILILGLVSPYNLFCSPFNKEIVVTSYSGHVNLYGINNDGKLYYERYLPSNQFQSFTEQSGNHQIQDDFSSNFYLYQFRKLEKEQNPISYFCYDPFSVDMALLGWNDGQICLMNCQSGHVITVFDKIQDKILDIKYSQQKSGEFYVITQSSKQILIFNVSVKKPIKRIQYQYNFIQILPFNNKYEQCQCGFLSDQGLIFILYKEQLVNINRISHQSIVRSALVKNDILYTGNSNGKIELIQLKQINSFYNQIFDIEEQLFYNSQFENIKHQKSQIIQLIEYKDYLIVCFNQGDICLIRYTGQILSVLVQGQKYIQKQQKQIMQFQFLQSDTNPDLEIELLRQVVLKNNILYTAWYDNVIRIFSIDDQYQTTQINEINLLKLSQNNDIQTLCITDMQIIDEILFITCNFNLLFVININQIENKQKQQNNNLNYTIFQINNQQEQNGVQKCQLNIQQENLILRQIKVKQVSEIEAQFIQQKYNKQLSHIILISSRQKFVNVFGIDLNGNLKDKQLIQLGLIYHGQKYDGNHLLGMKTVLFSNKDFQIIFSGLGGQSFLIDWTKDQNKQLLLKSVQQKVDTCQQLLYGNLLFSFHYDGSIKIYNLQEYENYQQYTENININPLLLSLFQQMQVDSLNITNYHLKQNNYNSYGVYLRSKSICFVLLTEIQNYYKFDLKNIQEQVYNDLNIIYKQNDIQQLYKLIKTRIDQQYTILNIKCEQNQNQNLYSINKLKYLIKLFITTGNIDNAAQLLYQIGLAQQSLSLAQLCSQEIKKKIMLDCFYLTNEQQKSNQDIIERFQLQQVFTKDDITIARVVEVIKRKQNEKLNILQLIKQLVQIESPSIACIMLFSLQEAKVLQNQDLQEVELYVMRELTNQCLIQYNIPQAINILLQNLQDEELGRIILLINDYNLGQYIINQLDSVGLNKYNWLGEAIKCNQKITYCDITENFILSLQQEQYNEELDQFSQILTGGLTRKQYLDLLLKLSNYSIEECQEDQSFKLMEELQDNQKYYQLLSNILSSKISKQQILNQLEKLDINLEQLIKLSSKILLLYKILMFSTKVQQQTTAQYNFINLILIAGSIQSCYLDCQLPYTTMQQQADRAVKKLHYFEYTAQKELSQITYQQLKEKLQVKDYLQYRGRQQFEVYENDIYQVLFGFNRNLDWF